MIVLRENGEQSEEIPAQAAISLGPVLEQSDTDGFEDTADLPSEDEAGGSSPSSACASFAASMHRSSFAAVASYPGRITQDFVAASRDKNP